MTRRAKADAEMRAVYAFLFGEAFDPATASNYPHAALLCAVAQNDKSAFCAQVEEFKRRRTSEGSGWYDNDSLVFLLLLGCERFQVDRAFLEKILAARDRNTNPVPKRVNEVFRALQRKEYGMEGEFSFIKIPFLDLTRQLALSSNTAEKPYLELTGSGSINKLSPFLQLLAARAYDLILFHRKPQRYESFDELVRAVEALKEHTSFRQVLTLVWALPYKWVMLVFLVLLPFIFGVGQKAFVLSRDATPNRSRPAALSVIGGSNALTHALIGVRVLANQVTSTNQPVKPRDHISTVSVEVSRLSQAAPKFSVELLVNSIDLADGCALLVQPSDGGDSETILPVQKTRGAIRAFVPPAEAGAYLIFVLALRTPDVPDPGKIASLVTVRALE